MLVLLFWRIDKNDYDLSIFFLPVVSSSGDVLTKHIIDTI